ncbi:hypothetical protein D3C75_1214780 [compost metagenome]
MQSLDHIHRPIRGNDRQDTSSLHGQHLTRTAGFNQHFGRGLLQGIFHNLFIPQTKGFMPSLDVDQHRDEGHSRIVWDVAFRGGPLDTL